MNIRVLKQAFRMLLLATVVAGGCSRPCEEDVTIADVAVKSGEMDTDFFYNDKGEQELFFIRKDKLILKCRTEEEATALAEQDIFLSAHTLGLNWVFADIDPSTINPEEVRKREDVVDAAYGLEYSAGALQHPSGKIFVLLKEGQSIEDILERVSVSQNVEKLEMMFGFYIVALNEKLGDMLRISRDLYETGLCQWAEPSFFRKIQPCFVPGDNTYFPDQWGLKNTGQYGGTPGIDIKAEQAWNITQGSSTIRVAVLDDGIDIDHPDLLANLMSGYDATDSPNANGAATATLDFHGTACAGIIAAANNNIGIIGVAPNVKIRSVRVCRNIVIPGNSDPDYKWEDAWAIAGFNWAKDNADVLSCSWYSDDGSSLATSLITAINGTVTNGRGGKGCVVVFSSGNGNYSDVNFPANLPNVIAVGAINQCGLRKSDTNTACDTEMSWGSNYGTDLDVVAPGVLIPTTDITGNDGYNSQKLLHGTAGGILLSADYANKDYTVCFDGTSSAAPHVAGIAALILSYNSNLTQSQVRAAIESSCTKLQAYTFNTTRPNGTWDNEVGYGLVNAAYAIVKSAGGYKVAFDLNGASGTVPDQYILPGGKAAQPTPDPDRSGYAFGGWFTTSSCTGSPVNFSTYSINADQILYAKWAVAYTVSFNLNEASGSIPSQTVPSGGFAVKPYPDPTRTDYSFEGWYTTSGCTGSAVNFGTYPITSTQTLYAKWTLKSGFEYELRNYSSYDLDIIFQLQGKLGSSSSYTTFIYADPGTLSSGYTSSAIGYNTSEPGGTVISSLYLDAYVYPLNAGNATLYVQAQMNDNLFAHGEYFQFGSSGRYWLSDFYNNNLGMLNPYGSTVAPAGSRRKITITIYN